MTPPELHASYIVFPDNHLLSLSIRRTQVSSDDFEMASVSTLCAAMRTPFSSNCFPKAYGKLCRNQEGILFIDFCEFQHVRMW